MPDNPSFAGLPANGVTALHGAQIVILGVPHGSPYEPGTASHAATAPDALRRGSQLFAGQLKQFDFDIGGALPQGRDDRQIVDAGNLELDLADAAANRAHITRTVRGILAAGAIPVVLGGDDSVPIPVFAAYEGSGPITILQIDAHVDWGDEIRGNRFGYGSPMRRASEMPWVRGMVQVGMRGLGSGTQDQHDDARRWGAHLITMAEFRRRGAAAALEHLPEGGQCFITIDFDGMDPTVVPAVNMPTPGGLSYMDLLELLHGVARKCQIVGATLVEFVPQRDDPNGLAGNTAARIALSVLGTMARQRLQ